MPPIAQNKYCPRYRIDHFITQKSYLERRKQSEIKRDIIALLQISPGQLWRLRHARVGESPDLRGDDLVKLAAYFGCSIADLINQDLPTSIPTPDSNVSKEESGISSVPTT